MLSETMTNAINDQIKWVLYSGYMYLSMSAYFSDLGLNGFAHWMRLQGQEELEHAMKFYDFVLERGGKITLQAVDAPPNAWQSPLDAFEETLKHEQLVTSRINDLVNMAIDERDHATNIFLQWFVTEQVEEEASVGEAVDKLKLVGEGGEGLFMIDKEMGMRTMSAAEAA